MKLVNKLWSMDSVRLQFLCKWFFKIQILINLSLRVENKCSKERSYRTFGRTEPLKNRLGTRDAIQEIPTRREEGYSEEEKRRSG